MQVDNQQSVADGPKYVTSSSIRKTFGISHSTLCNWAKAGRLDTIRLGSEKGKRLFDRDGVNKLLVDFRPRSDTEAYSKAAKVLYARVSSQAQKDDLERQVQDLQKACPGDEVIKDIASGINWKRPGLLSILERARKGLVKEVVVTHRDRLCRFAFELVEHVLRASGCRVLVLNQSDQPGGSESELKDDLLAILTVFVASNNGRRAAENRRRRKKEESQKRREGEVQQGDSQMPEMGDTPDQ